VLAALVTVAAVLLPTASAASVFAGRDAAVSETGRRAVGQLRLRHGRAFKAGRTGERDTPPCTCDCCDVVLRRPGEITAGAGVKCAPSTQHSPEVCGPQCAPTPGDRIFQDAILEFQRFCFFECKPAAGAQAPVTTQCVALTGDEATHALDATGNAIDPAFLYSGVPQVAANTPCGSTPRRLALAGTATHNAEEPSGADIPGHPDSVDPEAARKMGEKGRVIANDLGESASEEADRLRKIEEDKQLALNNNLRDKFGLPLRQGDGETELDPYAAVADIHQQAMSAKAFAQGAQAAAGDAVEAYTAARKVIFRSASEAAKDEVEKWKEQAAQKVKKDVKHNTDTWNAKAAAAAAKAQQPFLEQVARAEASVRDYNKRGNEAAAEANALWSKAAKLADDASALQKENPEEAESKIFDAREYAKQSQELAKEAKQMFATAKQTKKMVPMYKYQGEQAAAEAVKALNPVKYAAR